LSQRSEATEGSDPRKIFKTKTICPVCHSDLTAIWQIYDIPYFDEVLQFSMICECGYKYADTMIVSEHDPIRYELDVTSSEDLNARVVRSTTSTIKIPELGVTIEPGSAPESFITNIEGVLNRVISAVKTAIIWASESKEIEKVARGEQILKLIDDVKSGKEKITVIIEDPYGNSAILDKKSIEKKKVST